MENRAGRVARRYVLGGQLDKLKAAGDGPDAAARASLQQAVQAGDDEAVAAATADLAGARKRAREIEDEALPLQVQVAEIDRIVAQLDADIETAQAELARAEAARDAAQADVAAVVLDGALVVTLKAAIDYSMAGGRPDRGPLGKMVLSVGASNALRELAPDLVRRFELVNEYALRQLIETGYRHRHEDLLDIDPMSWSAEPVRRPDSVARVHEHPVAAHPRTGGGGA
jgi:uncharacterized small protein (DUF1192 family)